MSMQTTEAYDFALFAPRETAVREVTPKKETGVRRRTRLQSLVMVGFVLFFAVVGVLILGAFVYMGVQMTEATDQLADLRTAQAEAQAETARLQGLLAEQTSNEQVEAYAQEHGLRPLELDQIRYITVEGGDVVVVREPSPTWWERLFK